MAKPARKFDPPPPQTQGERMVAIETVVPELARREDVADLEGKMSARFERVDAAIERVDAAIERVDARCERLEEQVKTKADKADMKELADNVKLQMAELRRDIAEREEARTRWYVGFLIAIAGLAVAVLFRLGSFGG